MHFYENFIDVHRRLTFSPLASIMDDGEQVLHVRKPVVTQTSTVLTCLQGILRDNLRQTVDSGHVAKFDELTVANRDA